MALWFATIALLGIWARHPSVLAAIDPRYGLHDGQQHLVSLWLGTRVLPRFQRLSLIA
jgi:K+ transporter